MKRIVFAWLLGISSGTLWHAAQDPARVPPAPQEPGKVAPAPPPADAVALPPVPEPDLGAVPRTDLRQDFGSRDLLEGVYELRSRVTDGVTSALASRGYLAITRRHLFLCLAGPGSDPDVPLLRAGVRTWTRRDGAFDARIAMGFFNDDGGTLRLEPLGLAEVRRFDVASGRLRIWQDGRSYLEFERIE